MAKQTFTTGQVLTAAQMTSLQQTAMGGGAATAKTASYVLTAADAGTTVIMNSGSATTITVNTGLFAAGDSVHILNQGAGICTITAGTATVSSAGSLALGQNESGDLYFLSASAAILADYVQAAAASSGLTLITTQALSGVTAQSVNSCFSSTYANYLIVLNAYCATGAALPSLKLRASGTDATSSYYSVFTARSFADALQSAASANAGSWDQRPFGEMQASSTNPGGTSLTLFNPFAATNTSFHSTYLNQSTTGAAGISGGVHNSATSYDGFTITNTYAMTGTVRVYGLAN